MGNEERDFRELFKRSLVKISELKAKLGTLEDRIAIVGLGCRFPGGANDPSSYWQLLSEGRDAIRDLTGVRWPAGLEADAPAARWAGLLAEPVDTFDAGFFGIAPKEAAELDPQHRLLLETVWETFEDAGLDPHTLRGSKTGVFVGLCTQDYWEQIYDHGVERLDAYSKSGSMMSMAAGRVSYTFGLEGPSVSLDTACSSSLVAIHLACRSLQLGESNLALAGGVNLILSPVTMAGIVRLQALSPDGRCKTFDAGANGFVRGEGAGVVLLKRLSDAVRDGDRIWAVIRGSAVNQDGRSTGLTTPNVLAQETLLRTALENAALSAADISYVEAHGTGTSLGDPIEYEALRAVFGAPRADGSSCVLGSVKTNLGHLEAAAGVAGLMKVVLALKHQRIPRHLHFRALNPRISFDGTPFEIATEERSWPKGQGPRCAGVSSFGLSGTNAHVLLEEAPLPTPATPAFAPTEPANMRSLHLLPLSAKSPASLAQLAGRYADLLAQPDLSISDLCFSAGTSRGHLEERAAILGTNARELEERLRAVQRGETAPQVARDRASSRRIAFLFTGQGSQYAGMGRRLYETEPVFKSALDRAAKVVPLSVIFDDGAQLSQTVHTQPALFALELALVELYRSWGIEAEAMFGHSAGEYAAACAAGVLGYEDALALIAFRGRAMQALPQDGAMLSVQADEARVRAAIAGTVLSIAAINGPEQTVISGQREAIARLADRFSAGGVKHKTLDVSHAFHSALMDPMLGALEREVAKLSFSAPLRALVSNTSGAFAGADITRPEYWTRHTREAVRFFPGVQALLARGIDTFVEIGPHPTLLGMAAGAESSALLLPSLRRGHDDVSVLLETVARLYAAGVEVDWSAFSRTKQRMALPKYAWDRQRHWIAKPKARRRNAGAHPLLGARMELAGGQQVFESRLELAESSWLRDHRILDRAIVPAAAFVELACAAFDGAPARVRGLSLEEPLVVPDEGALEMQVVLSERTEGGATVAIYSRAEGAWSQHATGRVEAEPVDAERVDLLALRRACPDEMPAETRAEILRANGVEYGPSFDTVKSAFCGENRAFAELELPQIAAREAGAYHVHPALLDAALLNFAWAGKLGEDYLPFEISDFVLWSRGATAGFAYAERLPGAENGVAAFRVLLADRDGALIAEAREIRFKRADRARRSVSADLHRLEWREAAPAAIALEGEWAVAGESKLALEISTALRERGLGVRAPEAIGDAGLVCVFDGETHDARAAESSVCALLELARIAVLTKTRLFVVTRLAQAISSEDQVSPEAAALWGFVRALDLERPELSATLIDLGADDGAESVLGALGGNEPERAIRGGRHYVSRLAKVPVLKDRLPRTTSGTVLITGGLGALGLAIAEELVESRRATQLLLIARRAASAEVMARIEALRALGATVELASVDVSDEDALRTLLANVHLTGVVHAAGALEDAALLEQNAAKIAAVFRPKARGAWLLHELTRSAQLDFFVLFSSGASLFGSPGQTNYAAANAFLDGLAQHRRALGLPGLSINWGAWRDAGMAAALPEAHRARLSAQGFNFLDNEQGRALFAAALDREDAQLGALGLELRVLQKRAARLPAKWREVAPLPRVSAQPLGKTKEQLEAWVRGHAAQVIGFSSPLEMPLSRPLQELGYDSLMVVELRNRLATDLGRPLPATLVFDHPTVARLAAHLSEQLEGNERTSPKRSATVAMKDDPIAIVGVGCRYPGGVRDVESFWRLLDEGIDAITEMPSERWDVDALYDPNPDAPGKISTRFGGFLREVDRFDPAFFGIAPKEAKSMDPQQRLLLEVAFEALEDAGQRTDQLIDTATGVFVGWMYNEYSTLYGRNLEQFDGYVATGGAGSVASGRLSYLLGLKGPSITLDTACSSSLVAIHLACQSLRAGECEMALAGGVTLMLTPAVFVDFSRLRGLAPDGRCKSFDARGNGVGWSEGCGVIVLKRLSDARRKNDRVLAVIRGSAVNQDGRSNGLTAPNGPSQEALLRRALEESAVSGRDVDYVEGHGTGTPLGDSIELQALGAVLSEDRPADRPLLIGSVKSNLGHTQAAAGVAGVIKVALALGRERLPKSLHFEVPNNNASFEDLKLRVADRALEWPRKKEPRIAGVSSFGISGTNAHVVLEEAPLDTRRAQNNETSPLWLPLSAKSSEALVALSGSFAAHLEAHPEQPLSAITFTAAVRRAHHAHRAVALGETRVELIEQLAAYARGERKIIEGVAPNDPRKIVFVFPGQGGQWMAMGRELYDREAVFREAIDACDRALAPHVDWSLIDVLRGEGPRASLTDVDVIQPAVFAMQVALAAMWRSRGVEPAAVIGHSMGEVAASFVAGALTLEDAARVIAVRSQLVRRVSGLGRMAVVELTPAEAEARLAAENGEVVVGAINGPRSVVLSGERQALERVFAALEKDGVFCRWVKVEYASHSPQMEPLREVLLAKLALIEGGVAKVALFSTVTGERNEEPLDAAYWERNLRRPVLFWNAVERAQASGHTAFIEINAHPTLLASIEDGFREQQLDAVIVGSIRREEDAGRRFAENLARIHVSGAIVDWSRIYPEGDLVSLPGYPWRRQRHWIEPSSSSAPVLATSAIEDKLYRVEWRARPSGVSKTRRFAVLGGVALVAELEQAGAPARSITLAEVAAAANQGETMVALASGDLTRDAAQLLAMVRVAKAFELCLVTRGAVSVEGEPVDPAQTALWGLARVIAVEYPAIVVRMIDLSEGAGVAGELLAADFEPELAVRPSGRFAARVVPRQIQEQKPWRTSGTALITGGLSGVGLEIARWLAGRGAKRLVLAGRRGANTPGANEAKASLEALGAEVVIAAADVSDAQSLAELFALLDADSLKTIVHAAGVPDDVSLLEQTEETFARALAPKMGGVEALGALAKDRALDAFICVSSISSIWGGAGQGAYAAANAYLDGWVRRARTQGVKATAINYGPWRGTGRLDRESALALERAGIKMMGASSALEGLARALDGGEPALIVADVEWKTFRPLFESVQDRPLFSELDPGNVRLESRARDRIVVELERARSSERPALLEVWLREVVARALGLQDAARLDLDSGFREQGLDSVMAVQVRNRLSEELGVKLSATVTFNHPSVRALAKFLLAQLALGEAETRIASVEARPSNEPIAIIGAGCRMPGGIADLESLWRFLAEGKDAIEPIPADRFHLDAWFDANPDADGKTYVRHGGFVKDHDRFDAEFFGISPREASTLDPQQRFLLETSWEALENAGLAPARLADRRVGMYIGVGPSDYGALLAKLGAKDAKDGYAAMGVAPCFSAGRLSYALGLRGPSVAIDTACSSSLVALHLACQGLRSGESELALAGGVQLMLSPEPFVYLSRIRAISGDGRCKTFSKNADGYGRGEGCGVIVLKRLSDAERDGDRILAIVRGSAINHDGRSSGLTAPNGRAQEAVIRQALQSAGLAPNEIDYVEAHGTGTTLGDPIEVEALAAAYGEGRARPLRIGSLKTNLGHLESAAGVAGLLKVALSLSHRALPAHLHAEELNPLIDWAELPVEVQRSFEPWKSERPRRAGVSSFGLSGTNAHVILEEAPAKNEPVEVAYERPLHVLALSAKSAASLDALALRHAENLRDPSVSIADVCFTAGALRNHFEERRAIVAASREELCEKLQNGAGVRGKKDRPRRIAFIFTGQGSQYAGMGRRLYETQPVFRRAIDRCAPVIAPELLFEDDARLKRTEHTQPAMFALQYALLELWKSWGVSPEVVLGHSLGEYAAAAAAGVIEVDDALRLVALRGRSMQALEAAGEMLSVQTSEARIASMIAGIDLSIAAINGPKQVVVSGARESVLAFAERLSREQLKHKRLEVSHAFHSALMEPMLDAFEAEVARVLLSPPQTTLISNVTGAVAGVELTAPSYWRRHTREAVRFEASVRTALALGIDTFVELGPQPALIGMIAQLGLESAPLLVPTLRRGHDDWAVISEGVAKLYAAGVELDFRGFDAPYSRRLATIPSYAWQHERYWIDVRPRAETSGAWRLSGSALELPGEALHHVVSLGVNRQRYLGDHAVHGRVVVPGAFYLSTILAVAGDRLSASQLTLRDVQFVQPLVLDRELELHVTLSPAVEGWAFQLCTKDQVSEKWRVHCEGRLYLGALTPRIETFGELRATCAKEIPASELYRGVAEMTIEWGPRWKWISEVHAGEGAGFVRLTPATASEANEAPLHPAQIDNGFSAGSLRFLTESDNTPHLPFALAELRFYGRPALGGFSYGSMRPRTAEDALVSDLVFFDEDGEVLAELDGFAAKRAPKAAFLAQKAHRAAFYRIDWKEAEAATPVPKISGRWLVASRHSDVQKALVSRLVAAGANAAAINGSTAAEAIVFLAAAGEGAADAENASLALLGLVQAALKEKKPARVFVVTTGAQAVTPWEEVHPVGAALWGVARALREEHPELRPTVIDLDAAADLDVLLEELALELDEPERVIRGKKRYLARVAKVDAELERPDAPSFEVEAEQPGRLDSLALMPRAHPVLSDGEVEIEVETSGLNFRQVMIALGMMSAERGPIGGECAGVIARVAPGVADFVPGDRVYALAHGGFGRVTADARLVKKTPPSMSSAEAATIPIAFLTAYYALVELATLKPGERVLIHAAAGGVGMAAIQVAKWLGAKVYATASPAKQAIVRALGVEHVATSRSVEFASAVREATSGEGVDVVLDALAGPLVDASLSLLRSGGRFLEMGKTDIRDARAVEAAYPGVSYVAFDLLDLIASDPDRVSAMFDRLGEGFERGTFRPLPLRTFPVEDAPAAFRQMARGAHSGKIVLVDRRTKQERAGTVLITGGLGGLGFEVAKWMVRERGARHLLLLGRRAPSAAVAQSIEELAREGAQITAVQADVSDLSALERVIAAISPETPLTEVVHAAGVLDDAPFTEQNAERVRTVFAAKADGAWNLHRATEHLELERFVLFSSAASVFGSAGQASYAAANAFLDGLARMRRSRGLPAISLNWGPWGEAGMFAALDAKHRARFSERGFVSLATEEALLLLGRAFYRAEAELAVLALDLRVLRKQELHPRWGELVPRTARVATSLMRRLEKLAAEPRRLELEAWVREHVAQVLGLSSPSQVSPARPLQEIGFDSMMVVELRNRLAQELGQTLPATLVFDYPTVKQLGVYLADRIAPIADAPLPARTGAKRVADDEPIAIIGIGCRFPGGVADPEAYWRLLEDGVDPIREVPRDRWDIDAYFDPNPDAPGKMYARSGGFLDGIDRFDAAFFGISPREAQAIDPQQRLLLECSWEALERAGIPPESLAGSATGVYVGISFAEYGARRMHGGDGTAIDPYTGTGMAYSVATGRVSYALGLQGPSMPIDTACSSSLVALHLASQALRTGECTLALAGGVSLMLSPATTMYFSRIRALSPTGRCHTFDESADGYVRSEGCGVVVLKRLSDARRDGDSILALIRGSAVNQDGRSNGMTAPNGPAQEAVIRRALERAAIAPSRVSYVEAHGTGTPLGDPIELQALGAALCADRPADRPLYVGAVKSNIGHTEAAAGMAGLLKTVLALQKGRIPGNLHFEAPNKHVDWSAWPLCISKESIDWVENAGPRIAGLSGFGLSGTNAHLILEEAPASVARAATIERPLHVLPLSAKSSESLLALAQNYAEHLEHAPELSIADVCFTAASSRSHFEERVAITGWSTAEVKQRLEHFARGEGSIGVVRGKARPRKIVFVFTGQGSQYAGMGKRLYDTQPVFKAALDRFTHALPLSVLFEDAAALSETANTQPALFALEMALVELWKSWGIEPALVIGHSVGEYAAAVVAGVFSEADAYTLLLERGRLMQALPRDGEMASVQAGEMRVREVIGEAVSIAAANGPEQVVISGERAAVLSACTRFENEGIKTKRLEVSHAFHSDRMEPVLDALEATVARMTLSPPTLPLVSNRTGQLAGAEVATPAYWRGHAREPVLFHAGVQTLLAEGADVWIELGPQPTLLGLASFSAPKNTLFLPSLRRGQDDWNVLLDSVAQLYAAGVELDWSAFDAPYARRRVELPTYAWQRERHWLDQPKNEDTGLRGLLAAQETITLSLSPEERRIAERVFASLNARLARAESTLLYELEWRKAERKTAPKLPGRWISFGDPLLTAELENEETTVRGILFAGTAGAPVAGELQDLLVALRRAQEAATPLWVVTRSGPAQAALGAFARVVALEYPELWGGVIELQDADASEVARELSSPDHEREVLLRAEGRFVRRLIKSTISPQTTWSTSGAALITGGLGGVGVELARWLIARGTKHLVLAGRSGEQTPNAAAVRATLETLGARVTIASADAANETSMRALVSSIDELRVVVHAAGALEWAPLAELDGARLEQAISAKITGVEVLDRVTAEHPLDLFLCVSSIASVWGSNDQAAYSAANAYLDAFARERTREGRRMLSVSFGPWLATGRLRAEDAAALERLGIRALAPEAALEAMAVLVESGRAHGVVADVDWPRFRAIYESRGNRRLFAELAGNGQVAREQTQEMPRLLEELKQAPVNDRRRMLEGWLQREVAKTLGLGDPKTLELDAGFREQGLDSLMAVQLRNALNAELGVELSAVVTFNHPSVRALAAYLLEQLAFEPAVAPKAADKTIDELTDEEAARLLEQEIASLEEELR
jgi:epothilone polyketide synthase D